MGGRLGDARGDGEDFEDLSLSSYNRHIFINCDSSGLLRLWG